MDNVRSLVANRVTEFKILTFGPMGKIAKLKDTQLEFREVKKKFEKWEINENGGASYRVGMQ